MIIAIEDDRDLAVRGDQEPTNILMLNIAPAQPNAADSPSDMSQSEDDYDYEDYSEDDGRDF